MPPDMTAQELQDIVAENPKGYFRALHEAGIARLDNLVASGNERFRLLLSVFADGVKMHSEELAIFRALEVELRLDKITPDSLREYFSLLESFRQRVTAMQKAQTPG